MEFQSFPAIQKYLYLKKTFKVEGEDVLRRNTVRLFGVKKNKTNCENMQAINVKCNFKARFCNLGHSGKTISIICSECVLAYLSIHYAMCMRHIVICGLSGFTIFFHFMS